MLVLALIWVFATLADKVMEGDTRQFDEWVLSSLRQPGDPSQLRGPRWLIGGAQDITALGGPTVLGLTVLAVTGYLCLHGCIGNETVTFTAGRGPGSSTGAQSAFVRPPPVYRAHLARCRHFQLPAGMP